MNILLLSSSHPYKKAGIVAKDILDGFAQKPGINVKLVVKPGDIFLDNHIVSVESHATYQIRRIINRIKLHFKNHCHIKDLTIRTVPRFQVQDIYATRTKYQTRKILSKAKFKPDIILVLFSVNFLSVKNLYELQKQTGAKIFWQLTDMAPLTGICHYAWECDGFKYACNNCPAIVSMSRKGIAKKNLAYKIQYIDQTDITILGGSDWLIERIKESALFRYKNIRKVYLSVDQTRFIPINKADKTKLRKKYDVPVSAFIIGFGANRIDDERKGIRYIIDAINHLSKRLNPYKRFIVFAGNQDLSSQIDLDSRYLGRLNRFDLPFLYQICDLFVSASLQDVGPYMIVESLMCHVPVISFNSGFAKEFIYKYRTGILVDEVSAEALAKAIEDFIEKYENGVNMIDDVIIGEISTKLSINEQIIAYERLIKQS